VAKLNVFGHLEGLRQIRDETKLPVPLSMGRFLPRRPSWHMDFLYLGDIEKANGLFETAVFGKFEALSPTPAGVCRDLHGIALKLRLD
jgi:hypothetical protein